MSTLLGSRKLGTVTSWGTAKATTLVQGSTYVPLGDIVCDEVTIVIPSTGVAISVLGYNSDDPVVVDAPSGLTIPVAASANEIQVKRADSSNTPVDVAFIWRKFKH